MMRVGALDRAERGAAMVTASRVGSVMLACYSLASLLLTTMNDKCMSNGERGSEMTERRWDELLIGNVEHI